MPVLTMPKFPKPGTKVVRRHNGRQETRWVLDSTLGGQVVYVVGRWPQNAYREYGLRCSLEEWNRWAGVNP